MPKVESARQRIEDLNPDVRVVSYQERLTSENIDRILDDDPLHRREQVIVEVKGAVGQDVHLARLQDRDAVHAVVDPVDLVPVDRLERPLLVLHGDEFDAIMLSHRWLAFVGDWAYTMLMRCNHLVNKARRAGSRANNSW